MSAVVPPVPPTQPPAGPTIVRLPWWVNVVLVLTLLASCSAAQEAQTAASQARTAVDQSANMPPTTSTDDEVAAMCRLLGALAVKQGIDLNVAFGETNATTNCHTVAQEAATPSPPTP